MFVESVVMSLKNSILILLPANKYIAFNIDLPQ